jgi:hypothetical protein
MFDFSGNSVTLSSKLGKDFLKISGEILTGFEEERCILFKIELLLLFNIGDVGIVKGDNLFNNIFILFNFSVILSNSFNSLDKEFIFLDDEDCFITLFCKDLMLLILLFNILLFSLFIILMLLLLILL